MDQNQMNPQSQQPHHQGQQYASPQSGGYPQPAIAPVQPGYIPTNPGYTTQPAQTAVIVQPAAVVGGVMNFGPHPQNIVCPSCHSNVSTSVSYTAGTLTYITACLCFCFCCPCAWVPCVIDGVKDVTHHCPTCRNIVGVYKRM